jgi:predicted permease
LPRCAAGTKQDGTFHPDPIHLADFPKDPVDDSVEAEAPRKQRKPIGWSMIFIAVLVAVSVVLVWRRDGMHGVTEILLGDLELFGGILPRVLAGCLLGAFITEILPYEKVSRSLGPESGLMGLLIGTAFGAILPGGPFTAYPVAAALLTVGADFGAVIAMVVSWTLIGYGRAIAWELPILGTEFTLWRIAISVPIPILAGALGRMVYVRLYPKGETE